MRAARVPRHGVSVAGSSAPYAQVVTFAVTVAGANASAVAATAAAAALRAAFACALGVPLSNVTIASVSDGVATYAVDALAVANAAGGAAPCAPSSRRRALQGVDGGSTVSTVVVDVGVADPYAAAAVSAGVDALATGGGGLASNLDAFAVAAGVSSTDVNVALPTPSPTPTGTPTSTPAPTVAVGGVGL